MIHPTPVPRFIRSLAAVLLAAAMILTGCDALNTTTPLESDQGVAGDARGAQIIQVGIFPGRGEYAPSQGIDQQSLDVTISEFESQLEAVTTALEVLNQEPPDGVDNRTPEARAADEAERVRLSAQRDQIIQILADLGSDDVRGKVAEGGSVWIMRTGDIHITVPTESGTQSSAQGTQSATATGARPEGTVNVSGLPGT